MDDGRAFMYDCRMKLKYDDIFSVGEPLTETIGLRGLSGLCIFGNPLKSGVLGGLQGDKKVKVVNSSFEVG